MKQKITFQLLLLFLTVTVFSQEHFPGGVPGAEAWYMVNHSEIDQGIYMNYGYKPVRLKPCTEPLGNNQLFNFNHSVETDKLCLYYNAPMENTNARNVFFVGEIKDLDQNFSHLTTKWNTNLGSLMPTDSLVKNRFDFATKTSYFNKRVASYQTGYASVNFYHWNMYQTDKKYKSYGFEGETRFFIGQEFAHADAQGKYFAGNFPEFVSYPFELTANQKNRVESYLALKYGVTLEKKQSYRNSKNLVFWNATNNGLFSQRIFGIGRDDISWLNQLMSESVHEKDFLVKSVEKFVPTNPIKQELVSINDNHFIVSGDNGEKPDLMDENAMKIRLLYRKWLAQVTGKDANKINMFFKLNLAGQLHDELEKNPGKVKLWMLHDKYVTNQQVSDFTSQYVDYYEPVNAGATDYAFFENVFFDPDKNIYDQYTFGIGPEMIAQVRFDPNCEDYNVKSYVVITGGTAPYNIKITSTGGVGYDVNTYENPYAFNAVAPDTYTIYVTDSQGLQYEVTVDVIAYPMDVDLGPDVVLNASQQQVTLDAGQYVTDPNATYKWYHNGVLLNHYASTLVVDEPGEYTVEVATENRMCIKTDSIKVEYKFGGSASQLFACSDTTGSINLSVSGGIPPFTTVITGPGQTVYQVHNVENIVITDVDFGPRTVTTTDSNGEVFQTTVNVQSPLGGIELDLLSQLTTDCLYVSDYNSLPGFVCYDIILDAGALVTNPNVSYEWFMNGVSMNIYDPTVLTVQDINQFPGDVNGANEIMVLITNLATGCEVSESFASLRHVGIQSIDSPFSQKVNSQTTEGDKTGMISKVYPNPSASGATFYYEVSGDNEFTGTVEIFSPTGALLRKESISGQSNYTLSFNLLTSGVYFIRTTAGETTLTDKIIIK